MNLCRNCNEDFGGVQPFDAHRVGRHEYTYSEGLKHDPPVEDGRRCLSTREMETIQLLDGTVKFSRNKAGAWSLTKQLENARSLNE